MYIRKYSKRVVKRRAKACEKEERERMCICVCEKEKGCMRACEW